MLIPKYFANKKKINIKVLIYFDCFYKDIGEKLIFLFMDIFQF
jgi:hypothetical protein